MTPTPNAVERCKAVPIGERSEMSRAVRIDAHEMVYVTDLWKAFDTLLAENARLASEVRAGEETKAKLAALEAVARAAEEAVDNGGHQEQCDWFPYSQTKPCDCGYSALRDAVNAARSSGARGGAE